MGPLESSSGHGPNYSNAEGRLDGGSAPVNRLLVVHRLAWSTCPSSSGSATIPASTCSTRPRRTTTASLSTCSTGSTRWQAGSGTPELVAPGDLGAVPARLRPQLLQWTRQLRDAGRQVVDPSAASGSDDLDLDAIVADVPVRLAHSRARGSISPVTATRPHDRIRLALALAVLDATRLDPSRVRRCGRQGCVLLFLDTSKNSTRRWCDMAVCGNRVKAATHYQRHRPEGAPVSPG